MLLTKIGSNHEFVFLEVLASCFSSLFNPRGTQIVRRSTWRCQKVSFWWNLEGNKFETFQTISASEGEVWKSKPFENLRILNNHAKLRKLWSNKNKKKIQRCRIASSLSSRLKSYFDFKDDFETWTSNMTRSSPYYFWTKKMNIKRMNLCACVFGKVSVNFFLYPTV